MAYQSWSVVFGEQPSASKWGILGTNDASFNDGTGIFGLYKNLLTVDSNPYKFSAYRNAAQNTGNGSFAIINFDTELFDTNNNFDVTTNKGRYTAPVSGFYQFNARVAAAASTQLLIALYKNGSVFHRGTHSLGNGTYGVGFNELVQSAASDYWEIYSLAAGGALEVTGGNVNFSGFLVSRT